MDVCNEIERISKKYKVPERELEKLVGITSCSYPFSNDGYNIAFGLARLLGIRNFLDLGCGVGYQTYILKGMNYNSYVGLDSYGYETSDWKALKNKKTKFIKTAYPCDLPNLEKDTMAISLFALGTTQDSCNIDNICKILSEQVRAVVINVHREGSQLWLDSLIKYFGAGAKVIAVYSLTDTPVLFASNDPRDYETMSCMRYDSRHSEFWALRRFI